MRTLPVPTQTDLAVQDPNTGAVDYLKFVGTNLVSSDLHNYGLGSTFKIVANSDYNADGNADLVAQSTITGQLDFLYLNAAGNLIGSFLTAGQFPAVHGQGFFTGHPAGEVGAALVSQLADGSI